jgi:hypothetical protein
MAIEDQHVAGLASDDELVWVPYTRLRERTRHRCGPSMRPGHNTSGAVLGHKLVQHPDQRDGVALVDAPRRAISMKTLSARLAARIPTVNPDLVAAE